MLCLRGHLCALTPYLIERYMPTGRAKVLPIEKKRIRLGALGYPLSCRHSFSDSYFLTPFAAVSRWGGQNGER